MKAKSLMTQYIEGSIIGRELREMLSDSAASERFDRELLELDFNCYGHDIPNAVSSDRYCDVSRELLRRAEVL